jgi:short-subunit dehydrogenase
MAKAARKFWVASAEKAAEQIFAAIRKRKKHVYVTRRRRLVAWLIKAMPDWLVKQGSELARSTRFDDLFGVRRDCS